MTRFPAWLIAAYVVQASTWSMVTRCAREIDPCIYMGNPCCQPSDVAHVDYRVGSFVIGDDKDQAEDLAEALNQAHERRHPTLRPVELIPDWMIIHQSGNHQEISTYPKACEPNNCEKDAK